MEFLIRVDFGLISVVIMALILFGVGYNQVIALAERRGFIEGFTSLAVALGTLITLVGAAVISWQASLLLLACFAASGIPMIIGSICRYISARDLARKNLIEKVPTYADEAQTPGKC